jgi:hypothetical protein
MFCSITSPNVNLCGIYSWLHASLMMHTEEVGSRKNTSDFFSRNVGFLVSHLPSYKHNPQYYLSLLHVLFFQLLSQFIVHCQHIYRQYTV